MYTHTIETPLGPMFAMADTHRLYLLEFVERRGLERRIERLCAQTKAHMMPGITPPLAMIEEELQAYFDGALYTFSTPVHKLGTPFQRDVWGALQNIPYGTTKSYGAQAASIGKPTAFRAVANANGANPLAIIVPCHRIIQGNGKLGGYGGGAHVKKWLLQHEKNHRS